MSMIIFGCEGEEYDIETDEEFQQRLELAIENVFKGEATENNIIDDLISEFSDRYTEEEIREHVESKLDNKEEELMNKVDAIEQRTIELENQAMGYIDELEKLVDEAKLQEIEREINSRVDQIEALYDDLAETEDIYLMLEILEEMEEIFEEMVLMLEEKIKAAEEDNLGEETMAEDVNAYIQQVEPIEGIETSVISSFDGVTGDQYEGDEVMHDQLVNNIIPALENEILPELRDIGPGPRNCKISMVSS
ncbi:MAG: hypothetical protein R6U91_04840 [Bacillota bacterium]